jgi:HD-GYP domain-containing protein (c-di-GMP phosphodiesterase class II)
MFANLNTSRAPGDLRLSELVAGLSHGLDLAEGQPYGHAMRSCLIGMRLAEGLHVNADLRAALYYALLLKDAGGPRIAAALSALFGGDDHAIKRALLTDDWTGRWGVALVASRHTPVGQSLAVRLPRILNFAFRGSREIGRLLRDRGEGGAAVVRRLGLPDEAAEAVRTLHEHWDGGGLPNGARGEAIPLLARIALLAQTFDAICAAEDLDAAFRMIGRRRRTWFDPGLVDTLWSWHDDREWWTALLRDDLPARVVDAEPPGRVRSVDERRLDEVCEVFAEIIDAKTPFTAQNSTQIARWAVAIARERGASPAEHRQVYRAALLHDIGTLGVSHRTLAKPGPLTTDEHKAIERHAVHTWEILSRIAPLQTAASTAALHHERLDGSGYPHGVDQTRLDLPARILAVADVYVALISARPYRPAFPPEVALALLRGEGDEGRFDPKVVRTLTRILQDTPPSPVAIA